MDIVFYTAGFISKKLNLIEDPFFLIGRRNEKEFNLIL
jgi:hypothetical protein